MEVINHECYVSLEVAKLLKEAGFDWEVNHSYPNISALDNSCSGYMEDLSFYHNLNDGKYGGLSVPTLEVAQRWLREVKDVDIMVRIDYHYGEHYSKAYCGTFYVGDELHITEHFKTYEAAQETGIKKALELILEKGE